MNPAVLAPILPEPIVDALVLLNPLPIKVVEIEVLELFCILFAVPIVIFPSDREHSVFYKGKEDRIIIGVNFYSI